MKINKAAASAIVAAQAGATFTAASVTAGIVAAALVLLFLGPTQWSKS